MRGRTVVVLTNERDLGADDVIRRLDDQGVRVHRLNAEGAASGPVATWTPDSGTALDVGVVWWRQFELPADPPQSVEAIDDLLVVRAQWRAWIASLAAGDVPWINDLWRARRAENKLVQLRTARTAGFRLPETIVTNDHGEARRTFGDRPAVVKTLAAAYFELSGQGFVYTHALDDPELQQNESWYEQPLIIQERVDGADVRVVLVGDEYFGASCNTEALDWRTVGRSAAWCPWPVPEPLVVQCRRYARSMGLHYVAFDFIESGDSIWFLEANQAGEWVFLDRVLHLGIGESLTNLLASVQER